MSCPCDDYSPEYCLIHNPPPPKDERPVQKPGFWAKLRAILTFSSLSGDPDF